MASTVAFFDETSSGTRTEAFRLDMFTDTVTLRELIRRRVYEEVREYNASMPGFFKGLVQPTDAERTLNGYKLKQRRKIDWEEQFANAISAFQRNGYFVIVDDHQVETLDDEIELKLHTDVSFLKIVPLVGG